MSTLLELYKPDWSKLAHRINNFYEFDGKHLRLFDLNLRLGVNDPYAFTETCKIPASVPVLSGEMIRSAIRKQRRCGGEFDTVVIGPRYLFALLLEGTITLNQLDGSINQEEQRLQKMPKGNNKIEKDSHLPSLHFYGILTVQASATDFPTYSIRVSSLHNLRSPIEVVLEEE